MKQFGAVVLVAIGGFLALVGFAVAMTFAARAAGGRVGAVGAPLMLSLVAIAIGAAMIIAGRKSWRRSAESAAFDGRVGQYLADTTETRELNNRQYEVHFQTPIRGKRGRPSLLTVRVPAETPVPLRFKRETWFDRFGKRVGVACECQTGDAKFDDEVYVRGPSAGYAEQVLEDGDKRLAVRALLHHGMREVRLTGTHAEAAWQGFDPATDDRPEFTQEAAAGLFVLADRLPAEDPDYEVRQTHWHATWHVVLWAVAIALAASIAFVFVYKPVHGDEVFWTGLRLFAVTYPLFGVIAALALRGASTSHDLLWPLLLVGVVLIGLGSIGSVAAMNGVADSSQPRERKVTVSDKRTHRGRRGSRSHSVVVRDWNRPGKTLSFRVSRSEFRQTVPGRSQMELVTRRGWLDIEWLQSQHLRP
jgi:hypothetical protein